MEGKIGVTLQMVKITGNYKIPGTIGITNLTVDPIDNDYIYLPG